MLNAFNKLSRRVRSFILDHRLTQPGPLVVGVSGGADSLCLIHILVRLRGELGLDLHIAHLDHRLRGQESEADARFVDCLAAELGLPKTIGHCDTAVYRKEKRISIEEAAREVRYGFFAGVVSSIGAHGVAVGHTADDQAETILMHFVRGTGLAGLQGMRPRSSWRLANGGEITIIRPLLEATRQETEACCRELGLSPRMDSSNLNSDFLRNRIRTELLPLLAAYNPNMRNGLLRLGRNVQADMTFISEAVSNIRETAYRREPGGIVLNNSAFQNLSPSLKRHLLRSAMEDLLGSSRGIEQAHIESLMKLLEKPAGKELSLPDGLVFYGSYEESLISDSSDRPRIPPRLEGVHRLAVPGETLLPGWRVTTEVSGVRDRGPGIRDQGCPHPRPFSRAREKGELAAIHPSSFILHPFEEFFDLDRIGIDLTVRARRAGDRFQPLGMKEPKKLQDFMVDEKIPQHDRDSVPLVCSADRVAWVVGRRIDDRFKMTDSTTQILRIEFERV